MIMILIRTLLFLPMQIEALKAAGVTEVVLAINYQPEVCFFPVKPLRVSDGRVSDGMRSEKNFKVSSKLSWDSVEVQGRVSTVKKRCWRRRMHKKSGKGGRGKTRPIGYEDIEDPAPI